MAGIIFINYRRGDDSHFAGRLSDHLSDSFSRDQVFVDVDSIAPGLDFVQVLEEQVARCDVLLAVIGGDWLEATDESGHRRLDNPGDFVRIELEAALNQGKRVIPVLVGEARMPRPNELPDSLKQLARRNAVRLTHERFRAEVGALVRRLKEALQEAETAREAARAAAAAEEEVARKRREAEEVERMRAAEAVASQAEREARERARLEALAALSPEQITKAEELANWEFVKGSLDPQDFRDHLGRFPSGVTARLARRAMEPLVWQTMGSSASSERLNEYLREFPDGPHAAEAREIVEARERQARAAEAAWQGLGSSASSERLNEYLREFPDGPHAAEAREIVEGTARYVPRAPSAAPQEVKAGASPEIEGRVAASEASSGRSTPTDAPAAKDVRPVVPVSWRFGLSAMALLVLALGWLFYVGGAVTPTKPPTTLPAPPTTQSMVEQIITYYRKKNNVPPAKSVVVSGLTGSRAKGWEGTLEVGQPPDVKKVPLTVSPDGQTVYFGAKDDITMDPSKAVMKKIKLDDAACKGPKNAKVTIVEYADFQCPFCAKAYDTLDQEVFKEYGANVRFCFKDFPLGFHSWAEPAAIAAECVRAQQADAYWNVFDGFFQNQKDVNPTNVKDKAAAFAGPGLDKAKFDDCFNKKKTQAGVKSDMSEGQSVGVTGTPSFVINGRLLTGAQPFEQFKAVIDDELASAK